MTDWKGNKIEPGQTILKVKTKGMFDGCETVIIIDGKPVGEPQTIKQSYLWEITSKCLVKESGDNSMLISGDINEIGIDHLGFWFSPQYWEIVCIEGVSDNKEEYYQDYFKN